MTTRVPETVTIDGPKMFDALLLLLRAEEALGREHEHYETHASEALSHAFSDLWWLAFGDKWPNVDDHPFNCPCAACDLDENAAMPLYRAILEQAQANPIETEAVW